MQVTHAVVKRVFDQSLRYGVGVELRAFVDDVHVGHDKTSSIISDLRRRFFLCNLVKQKHSFCVLFSSRKIKTILASNMDSSDEKDNLNNYCERHWSRSDCKERAVRSLIYVIYTMTKL